MDLVIVPSNHARDVFLNTTYDKMDNNTKTGFDSKEAKNRIKKLDYLLKNDLALYNHLTRNGYIEYILNGDSFPYNN